MRSLLPDQHVFAAGTRPVSSSPSTAEQPLQSVSAASRNIQQEDAAVSTKASSQAAAARPASADAGKATASAMASANANSAADRQQSKQEGEVVNTTDLKLFATAGHEVTSFVADEEENDSNDHDGRQQTVSTTPYDELD